MKKIILASASPRRKEILGRTGLKFSVRSSNYKENLKIKMEPGKLARYLSRKKAEAVAHNCGNALIIAADTFIVVDGRVLGKPRSLKDAEQMLKKLSGRSHRVITGFTILDTETQKSLSRSVSTTVYFKELSREDILAYIRTGEPLDKAGAYAIQGIGAVLIEKISGDLSNVIGLPLAALMESLKKFGIDVLDSQ